MGRTSNKNKRMSIIANESQIGLDDFQIVLKHYADNVRNSAWKELYENKNYMLLEDQDADDFVTYRMNQAGANINAKLFPDTNPSVQELTKKIDKNVLDDSLSYLQNTKYLDVKKYMDSVAKDRQKLFDYAKLSPKQNVFVRNLQNKTTDWKFDGNYWFMTKSVENNGNKYTIQIEPNKFTKEGISRRNNMYIWDAEDNLVQTMILPVFNNITFKSTAAVVKSADVMLGDYFK
jgi:hypothetical protein